MYIVTGGAGFIGANLVAALNRRGDTNILVVDDLKQGDKFLNLRDLVIADYMDLSEFREHVRSGRLRNTRIRGIFHQGACSDTMEYDGRYMMDNNYTCSKELFHFAMEQNTPFIYASSAATYGGSRIFTEHPDNEKPLNVYGYSKLLFDRYVQHQLQLTRCTAPVAGLRYFNVYGPREEHKGRMASMIHQMHQHILTGGVVKLFSGSGGYGDGEQRRDFIYVEDVVKVNLFLSDSGSVQGIFNVGTGASRSFNDVARTLIAGLGRGEIRYVPMPEVLREKYQSFTQADVSRLRAVGYDAPFHTLEEGIGGFVAARERAGS
ncbi:MAG: ADP-glyceromanno-heptose 6-epimerase [Magnetococcales bacterium]|nr:ADP-glyceromanno-heptose 6-epimerase [Magnetococcales bacterium]